MLAAPGDLIQLRHQRKWNKAERRVLLVLLSGSRLMTKDRIEAVAGVRRTTVSIVLMLLEGHELAVHTSLGHYWLTSMGRSFCMEVVGLA
jgi:hypothetical protein